MNRNRYRLVFNQSRGQIMAVGEDATSQGKAASGERGAHGHDGGQNGACHSTLMEVMRTRMRPLHLMVTLLLCGQIVVVPTVQAVSATQVVADSSAPRSQQPVIVSTANGTPQVNITTPSAAGVSRNVYSQFDVGSNGLILNNSRGDVQTQQGGWVSGNPYLARGGARVILNEVNSSNPSYLNGYVEVAGQRAEVVIANPSGISVSGGGFINASRVVLTTGTPNLDGSGGISSYSVRGGQINIDGQGLDTRSADYTDIISRSLTLNAGVWANQLKVTLGANQVDAANTSASPMAGSGSVPTFAVDSTALGGMYANAITLIGTESGVGVRNAGQIGATAGNLQVTTEGQLVNTGQISASAGNLAVTANQGIDNSGTVYASGNANLTTAGNLSNAAIIQAGQNLTLNAAQLSNDNATQSSALYAGGQLTSNSQSLLNTGNIAGNSVNLAASQGIQNLGANAIVGALAGDLNLTTTGTLNNTGQMGATGNLNASATQAIQNSGTITASGNATLNTAGNLTNAATIQAGQNLTLAAAQLVNDNTSQSSNLLAGGKLTANVDTLTNTSTLIGGEVSVTATQSIINTGPKALIGATSTSGTLELLAPVIQNRDDVTATDTAPQTTILGLGNVVLAGGKDAAGQYTAATQVLNQSGLIESGQDMTIKANTLTNTRRVLTVNNTFTDVSSSSGDAVWTADNPNVPGGRYIEPPHGGLWNSDYLSNSYSQTVARNSLDQVSPEARILAGRNLTPEVSLLQNYWSKISAVGDVTLNNVTVDQDSWRGTPSLQERTSSSGTYNYRTYRGWLWNLPWGTDVTYAPVTTYDSALTAGGNIVGSGNTINNPTAVRANTPPGITASASPSGTGSSGLNLTLPTSNLYHLNPNPNGHYLVESNPLFANRFMWQGSDYYLTQLGYDPDKVQKRLGDTYYEEQLVRDQVLALTGKAVADGYGSAQAQFEAMYAEGAKVAKALHLQLGVSLTKEQAEALTSNLILLEEREVDTPTGKQKVLVPVVYLAHIHAGDLMANGPLIAGSNVSLTNTQGFTNSGTIRATQNLTLGMASGATLNNTGGVLQAGGNMQLSTVNSDIDLTSAQVKAAQLSIASGKNLILSTGSTEQTSSTAISTRTNTQLGRIASIQTTGDTQISTVGDFTQNGGQMRVGGNLTANVGGNYNLGTVAVTNSQDASYSMGRTTAQSSSSSTQNLTSSVTVGGVSQISVGRDLVAQGASLDLQGGGNVSAVGDIRLTAATDRQTASSSSAGSSYQRSYNESRASQSEQLIGTQLTSKQNLNVQAGHNLSTEASLISSAQDLSLSAGNDVSIGTANVTQSSSQSYQESRSGFLSGRQQANSNAQQTTNAIGSDISGNTVKITAGRDANIQGSTVIGEGDVTLTAKRDLTIQSAANTSTTSTASFSERSGLMAGNLSGVEGGIGSVSYGTAQQGQHNTTTTTTQSASLIGSHGGNVTATAGNTLTIAGSDVVASKAKGDTTEATGNIDLQGKNVNIIATQEQQTIQTGSFNSISGTSFALIQTPVDNYRNFKDASHSATEFSKERNVLDETAATVAGVLDPAEAPKLGVTRGGDMLANGFSSQTTTARGSSLTAAGQVRVRATGDGTTDADGKANDGNILVQGSRISAGSTVVLDAERDVQVTAAKNSYTEQSNTDRQASSANSSVSTVAQTMRQTNNQPNNSGVTASLRQDLFQQVQSGATETWGTGSQIIGQDVQLQARTGDVGVRSSSLNATRNITVNAVQGNVLIDSTPSTSQASQNSDTHKEGDLGSNGYGNSVGVGEILNSTQLASSTVSGARSSLTTQTGDISITAAKDLTVRGADLSAGRDLTMIGSNVNVLPGEDKRSEQASSSIDQVALSLGVSGTAVNGVQNLERASNGRQNGSSDRATAMYAAAAAIQGYNAYNAGSGGSGDIAKASVSISATSSQNSTQTQSTRNSGSTLAAGRDTTIIATGSGKVDANGNASDGDLTIQGGSVTGQNVTLAAARDLNINAARDTQTSQSSNQSSTASLGVGVGVSSGGVGVTLDIGASGSQGGSNGNGVSSQATLIQASQTLTTSSGRDTNVTNAQLRGNTVSTAVGRDLNLTTTQDSNNYQSNQAGVGANVSICLYGACGSSVSANASTQNLTNDYRSTQQQTGIMAGNGGYQVTVKGNTALTGAVIESSQAAIDAGKNSLTTGTLTTRDLENHANYTGISASGSASTDGVGAPTMLAAHGQASSSTPSGISGGQLTITDSAGQQALTGQTAAQAVSSVNRNVNSQTDTSGKLPNEFNAQQLQGNFAAASQLVNALATLKTNKTAEADRAKKNLEDASNAEGNADTKAKLDSAIASITKNGDTTQLQSLVDSGQLSGNTLQAAQTYLDAAKWAPGGTYSQGLTILTAAFTGNLSASGAQFVQSALGFAAQSFGAQKIKDLADSLQTVPGTEDATSAAIRAALQGLAACAGASIGGGNCGAAAMGAASAVVLNFALGSVEGLSAAQKKAREDLINTLIAGVGVATGASGVASAVNAASIEMENNQFRNLSSRAPIPANPANALAQRMNMAEIARSNIGNPNYTSASTYFGEKVPEKCNIFVYNVGMEAGIPMPTNNGLPITAIRWYTGAGIGTDFSVVNISIPGTGKFVEQLQPGDIVSSPWHVGIVAADGKTIISASTMNGGGVIQNNWGTRSIFETDTWGRAGSTLPPYHVYRYNGK